MFLWCECGYDGFATGDDPIVRSAVPFRPQMFSNGYFRGLARHPRACPECGTSPTMLLDTPNPNTANEVCDVCGYFGCLMAPMEVKRRGRKKDEWIKSEVSEKKKGVVIQFRPKHDEGNELAD